MRELAEAPDLMDRVVRQVQELGVVNERELIAADLYWLLLAAC